MIEKRYLLKPQRAYNLKIHQLDKESVKQVEDQNIEDLPRASLRALIPCHLYHGRGIQNSLLVASLISCSIPNMLITDYMTSTSTPHYTPTKKI